MSKRTSAKRGSMPLISMRASCDSAKPPGARICPCASSNFTPKACIAPAPASLVALPPMARMIRCAPASRAARINSPVPKVLLMQASRRSTGTSCKPLASAISMIAVWVWGNQPQAASTATPSGPRTVVRRSSPAHAASTDSTVPSPPSAIGHLINCASGHTSARPRAMASATP